MADIHFSTPATTPDATLRRPKKHRDSFVFTQGPHRGRPVSDLTDEEISAAVGGRRLVDLGQGTCPDTEEFEASRGALYAEAARRKRAEPKAERARLRAAMTPTEWQFRAVRTPPEWYTGPDVFDDPPALWRRWRVLAWLEAKEEAEREAFIAAYLQAHPEHDEWDAQAAWGEENDTAPKKV